MKEHVFVYGTLKEGYGNNRLLSRAKLVGKAKTVPSNFTMLDGGFPMCIPGGLYRVKGEVYEVRDQMTLDNLDRLEGVPHLFNRHEVEVETEEGEVIPAFMYVGVGRYANPDHHRQIIPDDNNVCEWSR